MARKQREERKLLRQVEKDPKLREHTEAWQQILDVQTRRGLLLGQTASFSGRRFRTAQRLVLMAAEDEKPNAERLREFRESARESLLQQLYSTAPIYDDLEQITLADSLALFVERRGGDHPLVETVLSGKTPSARAAELLAGTKLTDVAVRKELAEGGREAIEASGDPLIQLARAMEPEWRRLRKIHDELDELQRQAYAQIAEVQSAIQGTDGYPDATFTLRLAFGPVKGYVENGRPIPPWTTIGEAFEHEKRHGAKEPWELPASWHAARDRLDASTPMNFVCTADIIGGNSGSPVIDRAGRFVGIIFDGNIQSLTADYIYTDDVARAVSVHSAAILEALRKVYDAGRLADELGR